MGVKPVTRNKDMEVGINKRHYTLQRSLLEKTTPKNNQKRVDKQKKLVVVARTRQKAKKSILVLRTREGLMMVMSKLVMWKGISALKKWLESPRNQRRPVFQLRRYKGRLNQKKRRKMMGRRKMRGNRIKVKGRLMLRRF